MAGEQATYIIPRVGHKGEFVTVKQGEKDYYEMDIVTRFNADFAANFNEAMGHSDEDLKQARDSSFTGDWGWSFT